MSTTQATTQNNVDLRKFLSACLVLLASCILATLFISTLVEKKAVPVEESHLLEFFYGWTPTFVRLGCLAGVFLVLCMFFLAYKKLTEYEDHTSTLLHLAAGVLGLFSSYTLFLREWHGLGINPQTSITGWQSKLSMLSICLLSLMWASYQWTQHIQRTQKEDQESQSKTLAETLAAFPTLDIAKHLPGILLSALLCAMLMAAPVTLWSALRANSTEGLLGSLLLSWSGIFLFCLVQGFILIALLGTLVFFSRKPQFSNRMTMLSGFIAGSFVFTFSIWGLFASFADEFYQLELSHIVLSMFFVMGLFYGVAFSNRLYLLHKDSPQANSFNDVLKLYILSALLAWFSFVLQRIKLKITLKASTVYKTSLILLPVYICLLLALFPRTVDLFDKIRYFVVACFVLCSLLLGFLLPRQNPRYWQAKLTALGALTGICLLIVSHSQEAFAHSRPKVFRYDPLGKYSLYVIEGLILTKKQKRPTFLATRNSFASVIQNKPKSTRPQKMYTPDLAQKVKPCKTPLCKKIKGVQKKLKKKKPLIIMVIWDAARKDRMGVYGYRRHQKPFISTTPVLDKYKKDFFMFGNAFTQATATTCSLRHTFTSRYSSRYMLKKKGVSPFWTNELARSGYHTFFMNIIGSDFNGISIDAFLRTMPPDLRKRSYSTKCLKCKHRRHKSTDKAPHKAQHKGPTSRRANTSKKVRFVECNTQNEPEAIADLLTLLKTQKQSKGSGTFAMIHMDGTHTPWRVRKKIRSFGTGKQNLYDHNVFYSDYLTGKLIDGLKKLGMWDETLFIVTSDHGTGLNDHGSYGGFHPWNEQIRIPLLIKFPGLKGRMVKEMVGLFDLGPTLMEIFQPQKLPSYEGQSLWPLMSRALKGNGNRVLFGLNAFADCYYLIHPKGYHYILHRTERYEQLYNINLDRTESKNLIDIDKKGSQLCRQSMHWFLNVHGKKRSYNNPFHYRKSTTHEHH